MKLFLLIVLTFIHLSSSASMAHKRNKSVFYNDTFVEAHGRTITVFGMHSSHILEEIERIHTPLPIICLALMNKRFLFAFCRLGRISRVCMWDLHELGVPI